MAARSHAPLPAVRAAGSTPSAICRIDSMTVSDSLDIPFAVPCVHRLRFTKDVLGLDQGVLASLLEPSGDAPARVQVWLDGQVDAAQPQLQHRLRAFLKSQPQRFTMPGNIQVVPGGEAIKNDIHV